MIVFRQAAVAFVRGVLLRLPSHYPHEMTRILELPISDLKEREIDELLALGTQLKMPLQHFEALHSRFEHAFDFIDCEGLILIATAHIPLLWAALTCWPDAHFCYEPPSAQLRKELSLVVAGGYSKLEVGQASGAQLAIVELVNPLRPQLDHVCGQCPEKILLLASPTAKLDHHDDLETYLADHGYRVLRSDGSRVVATRR